MLERIFVLEDDNQVLVKHIPPRIMRELEKEPDATAGLDDFAGLSFQDATAAFQTRLLEAVLRRHDGNPAAAAEKLGMTPNALPQIGRSTCRERGGRTVWTRWSPAP